MALLVALQAAHHNAGGAAAVYVERVFADAVLRRRLALAAHVDAVLGPADHPGAGPRAAGPAAAGPSAGCRQVGHAARVGAAQVAGGAVALTLALASLGGRVLGQRGVVGVAGGGRGGTGFARRVEVIAAGLAGAGRAVVQGVGAVGARRVRAEVRRGGARLNLQAQQLTLRLQAGAAVAEVLGQTVQPRGADIHRPETARERGRDRGREKQTEQGTGEWRERRRGKQGKGLIPL